MLREGSFTGRVAAKLRVQQKNAESRLTRNRGSDLPWRETRFNASRESVFDSTVLREVSTLSGGPRIIPEPVAESGGCWRAAIRLNHNSGQTLGSEA